MIVETMHCDNPQGCRQTVIVGPYKGDWLGLDPSEKGGWILSPLTAPHSVRFHACCFDCAMKLQHDLLLKSTPAVVKPTQEELGEVSVFEPREFTCPVCEEKFSHTLTSVQWEKVEEGDVTCIVDDVKGQSLIQGICPNCIIAAQEMSNVPNN